ncbi:hypothetical protein N9937_01330 [bacterium]|nr:hypothetical protein [bacterium]
MGKGPSTPDVVGEARAEGEANRRLQRENIWQNRVDQSGPFSTTKYTSQQINPNTGQPWKPGDDEEWKYFQEGDPYYGLENPDNPGTYYEKYRNPDWDGGGPVDKWSQQTTLNPEYQALLDQSKDLASQQFDYRSGVANDWGQQGAAGGPGDFASIGNTISRDQLAGFGPGPAISNVGQTIGADDWRQFGTTGQTIGANDYEQFGRTEQTIGANDWRQFGTSTPTIDAGTYDERFGDANQYRDEFGDHSMEGSDWDYVQYAPEALRQQAQDDTYAYQTSRLDPQFEQRLNDLKITMRNQGLQPGDQQWEDRMASYSKSKNSAYSDARNTSLADSRAEAAMLWDQEMGRSQQKNQMTQADVDNIYRARQGNIQNYLGGRQQDMQGYLDYSNSAFGQDMQSRQQQLDANLGYGREAYYQDLSSRQQQLDADLNYGREAYQQDYQTRQQNNDNNLAYGQQAYQQDYQNQRMQWDQGFQQNQADITNNLRYGQQEYDQQYQSQQQQIAAQQQAEQLNQQRYQLMNPGQTIGDTAAVFQG